MGLTMSEILGREFAIEGVVVVVIVQQEWVATRGKQWLSYFGAKREPPPSIKGFSSEWHGGMQVG